MYPQPIVITALAIVYLLTLAACWRWRHRGCRPAFAVALSLLLLAGPVWLAWVSLTAHGDGAVYVVGLGGPALALLALLAGVPLLWGLVTRHWGKALAIAAISLLGHIATGWPQNFAPDYAAMITHSFNESLALRRIGREAEPLLQEYGIALPNGCTVLKADITPLHADAFTFPQARLSIRTPGGWTDPVRELSRQLQAQGYREEAQTGGLSAELQLLVKEPFVADVSRGGYRDSPETVELTLAQDRSGMYLPRWITGWRQPRD